MKLAQELLNLPFKLIFGEAEPLSSESVKQGDHGIMHGRDWI